MDFNSYLNISLIFSKILPIIYAILGFCGLIVIHELGHFLFCKLFGIHTPTFSVGIGPKILEKKIGDTNFRLSAIPLGGYCEIAGNVEVGQGEQEHAEVNDETSFKVKPYWQKLLVLLGGIIFNLAFAYFAFITLYVIGKPKTDFIVIKSINSGSLAEKSGLKIGDKIISMGNSQIEKNPGLLMREIEAIQNISNQNYEMTLERNNNLEKVTISFPELNHNESKQGRLGIQFDFQPSKEIEKFSLMDAIPKGISATNDWICLTAQSIKNLFKQRAVKGAGPVMIISESIKKAQQGFSFLLIFLAIISINLALFNLLPLPILDGGQLLFATIEALTRREITPKIKIFIFICSWIFILGLLIVFTYNDIRTLIGL